MATSELIGLLANIALTLSLIVAVIFGIAQARQAARGRARMSTTPRKPYYEARRA